MNPRPYAVFDIDGTIIRWQLYHALADTLAKKGIIEEKEFQKVRSARMNWKSRRSTNSFVDYEKSLIRLIDRSLPGVDYEVFSHACSEVIDRYKDQVYTFTRDFLAQLRQENYLTFAISASPKELVKQVAIYYGFDDYDGSDYEINNGRLSGNKKILLGSAKSKSLIKMIDDHGATNNGSIAVGDTLGDIELLSIAERPIAFNPSKELFEEAFQKKWELVIERKNVVYSLKYKDGQYILIPPRDRQTYIL